ncbi:MAG TPA: hypothetical protein IGS53_02245 [Leptolyngbyaceae cyanobacterium M33_DOE_097]|uniref:Uncharacterized protein n=1 Tax=Oscillatoriales cyanobacterium SpSt-418 TaxID=2282169 RepID=A0A7C3PDU8_9CYAN|nr:hypothetical protein [Leptolyngbyaceae cyanobacterium M33_DOE_097]
MSRTPPFFSFVCFVTIGLLSIGCTPTIFKSTSPVQASPKPSATSQTKQTQQARLEFRLQKPGTEADLYSSQQRYRELRTKQTYLRGTARQANAKAIAQLEQKLSSFYGPAVLTYTDFQQIWVESDGTSTITVQFTPAGGKKLSQVTRQIAGTGRALGIFWGTQLISNSAVDAIYAGSGITGSVASFSASSLTPQQVQTLVEQVTQQLPPPPKPQK